MLKRSLVAIAAFSFCVATTATAETRVTYKSAKSTTSYYQMAVQVAEGVKSASNGNVILTVEESQGSVQNVKEAGKNRANYVFTTPPSLIVKARDGVKPFKKGKPAYQDIRALYPIPSLVMHWVVREDAKIANFQELDGKNFIVGRGNFSARKTIELFKGLGLENKVNAIDVEVSGAVSALKNRQVQGFATSSSFPAPNVLEAASSTSIQLLSLSEEDYAKVEGTPITIPAGTYPGVDTDTQTISLPVGAYTMKSLDEETAYQLTKAFWNAKKRMANVAPWWKSVTVDLLGELAGPLHPGAIRYYKEQGITLSEHLVAVQ